MRWVRLILLSILVGLLQVGLLGALRVGGAVPNLALVALIAETIWGRASEALLFAVVVGSIVDMASAGTYGLATSTLVLIGLMLIALYQLGFDGKSLLARCGLVAAASVLWGIIHIVALDARLLVSLTAWYVILVEVTVNVILGLVIGERVVRGARKV